MDNQETINSHPESVAAWKRKAEQLQAENAALKKQALAQQGCIEQMLEALAVVLQCRPIGYETMTEARERKIREALARQPDLSALREHDAAVRANERQKMLEDLKLLADDHGRVNLWEVE